MFKPEKREEILKSIITDDYDGIIIAYSCFEMIPLSKEYYSETLKELKKRIEDLESKCLHYQETMNTLSEIIVKANDASTGTSAEGSHSGGN